MNYTEKDRSIISQVAVKAAVELVVSGVNPGVSLRDAATQVQNLIFDLAAAPIGGTTQPALAPVADVVQLPTAQAAVAPVATDFAAEIAASDATQAAVLQAIPGAQVALTSAPPHADGQGVNLSKAQKAENEAWALALLQHDPSLFWDNRADKAAGTKKPTYPDFKHKDSGVGLWLD